MSDEIKRHEIIEERANRDAFHALLIVAVLFALLLGVLGILAWRTQPRVQFFPLTPKAVSFLSAPRVLGTLQIKTADRPSIARGAVSLPPVSVANCRPVPGLPARGFPVLYPAKAMPPSSSAQAAGLQQTFFRLATESPVSPRAGQLRRSRQRAAGLCSTHHVS